MKIHGIVLADQHFGVIGADKLYEEHEKIIIAYLLEMKKLDVIFIAGDFFDHILYLNETHANRACMFMDELVWIAKSNNAKIRIIYGTESHECNQYNIFFNRFIDKDVDFRVINTVEEEELFPDFWVLYLPEEYIYNKQEYYEKYFTGEEKYGYIIGHGVIQELMSDVTYHIKKSTKNTSRAKVPVFTSTELLENCYGEVYFGHYHINSSIKNRIFYVGSFTRWCHGEEEPKGFYEISTDGERFKHKFIENTYAEKFTTLNYGYNHEIFKDKDIMEQEWKKIEKLSNNDILGHTRLIINVPENYPEAESMLNVMGERFKNQKNIKIKVVNGFVDKNQKINKEYLEESMKKYGFIFDKSMPIHEQASQFILTKFDQNISSDRVGWHLKTSNILESDI